MTQSSYEHNQGRLAVIAGNGHFPFLVLDAARDQGIDPLVFAIREEASPELARSAATIHWLSLGELAKLLDLLGQEHVKQVVLAGQVKHRQLYSSIPPDTLVKRTLGGMDRKNTDALIGAFVKMLEGVGVQVLDSTVFLKPLLAEGGVMTRRRPDSGELADLEYGREVANKLAALDIGQT